MGMKSYGKAGGKKGGGKLKKLSKAGGGKVGGIKNLFGGRVVGGGR